MWQTLTNSKSFTCCCWERFYPINQSPSNPPSSFIPPQHWISQLYFVIVDEVREWLPKSAQRSSTIKQKRNSSTRDRVNGKYVFKLHHLCWMRYIVYHTSSYTIPISYKLTECVQALLYSPPHDTWWQCVNNRTSIYAAFSASHPQYRIERPLSSPSPSLCPLLMGIALTKPNSRVSFICLCWPQKYIFCNIYRSGQELETLPVL